MIKKIVRFIFYPIPLKLLFFKAVVYSISYEIWLKSNKFDKIKAFHQLNESSEAYEYTDDQHLKIKHISKAIKLLKQYAPWRPECYNLAMTARKLLSKRTIPSNLHIGFKKEKNALLGHAWVKCNTVVVSGFVKDLKSYNQLKSIEN